MFAPPITRSQTKPGARSNAEPSVGRSRLVSRQSNSDLADHLHMPWRHLGSSDTAWNFGEVSTFAPNQSNRFQSAFSTSPRPRLAIQAKLVVGPSNDPLEREADNVADRVMSMSDAAMVAISAGAAQISRKCAACEADDEQVQRKAASAKAVGEAPHTVHEVLRAPGQSLDPGTRAFFEPRFGQSLSHIRVHTDNKAATSAQEIGARAYTHGSHIVFAPGSYQPGTHTGLHLLAHELTHTAQQEQGTANVVQRVDCADYNESTKAECEKHKCITRDGAKGRCSKTGLHTCVCVPEKLWRLIPGWLLVVLSAATLAAIAACFATGVCEFAAVVAGLGALTAAAVIAVLKAAGVKDSKGA